jgi:PAS domain S-box-containing protein
MNVWLVASDRELRESVAGLIGTSLRRTAERLGEIPEGESPDVLVVGREVLRDLHRRPAFNSAWILGLAAPGCPAQSLLDDGADDVLALPASAESVAVRLAVAERLGPWTGMGDEVRTTLSWLGARARDQAALSRPGATGPDPAHPDRIRADVLGLLVTTLGADGGRVLEVRRGSFELTATTSGEASGRESIDASCASGYAFLHPEPVSVNDYAAETRFRLPPALGAAGARSGLHVAIRGPDWRWGVLEVYGTAPRQWAADEIRFASGAAYRLAVALDRQRLGEALLRSEANFRTLIQESPDATAVVRDGVLVLANPAFGALTGRKLEELLGSDPTLLVAADERGALRDHLRQPLEAVQAVNPVTFRIQRPSGPLFFESISRRVMFDDAPSTMLVARDLTERLGLQDSLAAVDRLTSVGTLAAGVTHEINNPLAYVSSNLAFLADELRELTPRLPEALHSSLEDMTSAVADARQGTDRIRRIVLDLKAFSRADLDRIDTVDVAATVEMAINLAASALGGQATVERQLGVAPAVQANPGRLAQVIVNLLVNAVQSLAAQGPRVVRVVTRTDAPGRAVIEVHDSGLGMPEEVRSRIFEPFFTTKPIGVGTGLGLSVCHGIITAMGGEIEVESQPGRGSVFRVLLPPTG